MITAAPPDRKLQSQSVAIDEAHASLGRLGVPDVLPALHSAGVSMSRSVLGGSHSVAIYPPLDSLMPVDANHVLNAIRFGPDISLYLHIPFCETRCTFCHYAVQHYPSRGGASRTGKSEVARYLEALKHELAFWGVRLAQSNTALSSIYIGGGTPLVLEQETLQEIIRVINNTYDVLPGAEVCLEASPLTITAPDGGDKLSFLAAEGVTRLSFGVQSFDNAVLRHAARGYKRDVPIRAAQIVRGIFDNWNLDLIQGLYKGSPTETWQNLEVIADLLPPHLTWYHARFADRPQGRWYKSADRHRSFEDERATLLGRMLIWEGMHALGYQQTDGNRFVREPRFTDLFKKVRTSPSRDLLGVGPASYSHVSAEPASADCHGYVFRNETHIGAYAERVLSGDAPVVTGRVIDDEELLASSYATGLRHGRTENPALRAISASKPQLSAHCDALVHRLSDVGVLEHYANGECTVGLRLTELGRLFEDETLALFFSPAVKQTLAERAPEGGLPRATSQTITSDSERERLSDARC